MTTTSINERLQIAVNRMHEPWGGVHALDFANTLEPRGGPPPLEVPAGYQFRDELETYDDLVGWAVHKGTIEVPEGIALIQTADNDPDGRREVLGRAHLLRDAIYRASWQIANIDSPSADDLRTIMDHYVDAAAHARLIETDDGIDWSWSDVDTNLARPLWPVARSAVDLLLTGDRNRIKVCPGPGRPPFSCGWLFYDSTKNGSRRWCSMSDCGAATKIRRQTNRRREHRTHDRS